MANEKNRELIDNIVDKLKAHELPYQEGSWERFASKNNPFVGNKKSNWKYWSAAAAVLLISGASFFYLNHGNDPLDLPVQTASTVDVKSLNVKVEPITTDIDTSTSVPENSFLGDIAIAAIAKQADQEILQGDQTEHLTNTDVLSLEHLVSPRINPNFSLSDKNKQITVGNVTVPNNVVSTKKEIINPNHTALNETVKKENQTMMSVGEQLARLGSLYPSKSEKHDFASALKKWEVGAFVAPASTADKIGLGGGLSLAYQVSDKVSIRSGVSMQEYGAGANRQTNPGAVQSASLAYNDAIAQNTVPKNNESLLLAKQTVDKDLSGVSNKLLTVDIPVDVRYHVTKSLYTSVGVSYVGVVNQTQDNYFVDGINEDSFVNNKSVVSSPETVKQSFKGNSVSTDKFNGFVNFSIGKKIGVGSKLSIAVEPFVKLPIGGLKSTDLNYTNGGLKIVTSF
ncbi:hypothetical protein LZQ00_07940 [Sphingobacterium sp. SRCM116780]|uniref:hypothetical protein n=1 Tax=Sphingobacterium sp. SRCM116780 TaxID=2907623 RepID=UPI001F27DE85|nr:hypothetical protein [Sphingobacterium sp. SRCM116780]UIR57742.1 hypothetical protein LZQ00_07940 [Sphingobacterium sp. SRCM116780]